MNLDRLKTFCLVAQNASLLQAAQKLKLSPATVSLRLKQLEREIGVPLFEHKPNRLVLSAKGKVLLAQAQRILQQIDDSVALLRDDDEACKGSLSVLVGVDLAHYLAPRVASFVEQNPAVNLSVLVSPSPESLRLILDGQADIAIGRFLKLPRWIAALRLFTSTVAAIFPAGHPFAGRTRLSLRDLAAQGLIVPSQYSVTRRVVHRAFAAQGLEMRTVLEAGGCSLIREYAQLGLGVGLVHEICVRGKIDGDLVVRDLERMFGRIDVLLIYRKDRVLTPAHRRFIEALSDRPSSA
ncbi:MAG TPA: LysR substrate-binding domain-containing protein [candidate division Zixibacteria bacterium]|nr:LysR substrate-binding domain-containing protein [candidate division Zixibacteria bacterium]